MRKKPLNKKSLVVKSNEINEAHYKLSANEQKLILTMISQIQPEDADFKPYRIEIKELRDLLGISTGDIYPMVAKMAKDLRARELVFYNSGTDSYLNVGWLSASEYFQSKGYVELEFSPRLKPYLLQLKQRFTSYRLQNIIQLKSGYAIRLYELLRQYGKIGKREFEVIELRKILGIADNEYRLYGHFKERVLLVAQKELAAKTDLQFSFEEIKTGRAVTSLRFNVLTRLPEPPQDSIAADYKVNDPYDIAIEKLQPYERDLFQRLQKTFKLSKKQAHEITTGYLARDGKERVEGVMDYCHAYWQKSLKIDRTAHIGAITWTAFKDSWQIQPSLFQEPIKKPVKKEIPPEPTEEERAEVKRLLAEWRKQYDKSNAPENDPTALEGTAGTGI
ncbi:MAG: replication initiation protein [Nitrospirae bacterium]|nr:replication initiation protein [Nitrospirota bacterium]